MFDLTNTQLKNRCEAAMAADPEVQKLASIVARATQALHARQDAIVASSKAAMGIYGETDYEQYFSEVRSGAC